MRTPLPYSPSVNQKRDILLGTSGNLSSEEYQWTQSIKETFQRRLGYTKVYKNFDDTYTYETDIYEGDSKDKDVFYKRILSYPYDKIRFERGDYIHFKYGGVDTVWLLETLDKQHLYDINGKIFECQNNLKWQDENYDIISYPCVIQDRINGNTFDLNSNIITPDGTIFVEVQQNDDTMKIKDNQRFLFDGQPFKVNFRETFIGGNYISLTMVKESKADDDNLELGIANYRVPVVMSSGIQISPIYSYDILQGSTIIYTVSLGITSLTISDITSGISGEYYIFTNLGNNQFSIQNIKKYNGETVDIQVSDGGVNTKTFNFSLKGVF